VRILVGLGNPGAEYRRSRHNVGFMVVEEIARRRHASPEKRAAGSALSHVSIGGLEVVLSRPLTYMNRSGAAVKALLEREGAGPGDLLVVCDDLYLDYGSLRLRRGGSHGGHNGLRSIIEAIGTQRFARLRIGVGPVEDAEAHADFVLAPFDREERERLPEIVGVAADCVMAAVSEGLERTMNRFNRRPAVQDGGPVA
jgi:PTH1 family peptidyl-tRNA hydrolase